MTIICKNYKQIEKNLNLNLNDKSVTNHFKFSLFLLVAIMTLSPKKFVSNFTSSTTNRGVEAKEIEIVNTRLDINTSSSTQFPTDSTNGSIGEHVVEGVKREDDPSQNTTLPTVDDTGSYIQVVVQKHRHKKEQATFAEAQTSPRLPTASSPKIKNIEKSRGPYGDAGINAEAGGIYVMPHPMLFTYPPMTTPHHCSWPSRPRTLMDVATSARSETIFKKVKKNKNVPIEKKVNKDEKQLISDRTKASVWKNLNRLAKEKFYVSNNMPDRVEVYYFERSCGDYLATSDSNTLTFVERIGSRGSRIANRLLAELLAAPQLLATLPVVVLLSIEKSILILVRGAIVGSVQTLSDYILKPILTLLFNAFIQPPLVFSGNVAKAIRGSLQPVAHAFGDFLEPITKLLGAFRIVHIERHYNSLNNV